MASSSSANDLGDIDKLLSREATAFQREIEVNRILKAFKLNPYEILDLDETCSPEDIKRKYRHLSLFIHPDKTAHAQAPEAFDLLKKAESELSDKDKREELDALVGAARNEVLRGLSLPARLPADDPRISDLTPPFRAQHRARTKEMLIEEEVRRRKAVKMNLANEGLAAAQKDAEVTQKKRKLDSDARWEEGRETRVDSWRSFANGAAGKKKKKTKSVILG